jgi:thiosulfate dehydrogenase [quinone] large subunit
MPGAMETSRTAAQHDAIALAGLRVAVGCLFLIFGQYKVLSTQFTLHGGFQWWSNKFLQDGSAYPFMVPVLTGFVLPHSTAIAFLVAYGELAIGLALVLGVLVRIASVFALIYMLTLLFSSNFPGHSAPLWEYFGASLEHSVLALCFATFIVAGSIDVFSVKKYFAKGSRGLQESETRNSTE